MVEDVHTHQIYYCILRVGKIYLELFSNERKVFDAWADEVGVLKAWFDEVRQSLAA